MVGETLMCLHSDQSKHSELALLVELPGIEPAAEIAVICRYVELDHAKERETT
jgi:hypothetical protein